MCQLGDSVIRGGGGLDLVSYDILTRQFVYPECLPLLHNVCTMYAPSGHKDLLHLQLDYKQMSGLVS